MGEAGDTKRQNMPLSPWCPELCNTDIVLHCPEIRMIKPSLFDSFPYFLDFDLVISIACQEIKGAYRVPLHLS